MTTPLGGVFKSNAPPFLFTLIHTISLGDILFGLSIILGDYATQTSHRQAWGEAQLGNSRFNSSSACSCKENDVQPCRVFRQSIVNVLEHARGGMSKSIFFQACRQGIYLVESPRSSAIGFGWWVAMSPLGGKHTGPVRWCDMSLMGRNSKWTWLEEISQLWTYV